MTKRIAALILTAGLAASGALAAGEPPYRITADHKGPEGSYDYVSVDDTNDRVFVGREFGVMTLDPATGKTTTLLARDGVAAVLPIPETRLMLSTNGDLNTATLFDRDTGAVRADIATGTEPDGAYYDTGSRLAFVMNGGSGDVTVIDIATAKAIATIPVGGTPEGAVGNGKGRLFVNIEDTNAIAVIDIARRKVVARYTLKGCEEPTGIAYDPRSSTLMSACRNSVLTLTAAATGRHRGVVKTGKGADGAVFDAASRTGFVPAIDGTLTVFRVDSRGGGRVTQTLKTRIGARTAVYDAKRDRLFLPYARVERDSAGEYIRAKADFGVLTVAR